MQQLELELDFNNTVFAKEVTFCYSEGIYHVEADLEITEDDITLASLSVYNSSGIKVDPVGVGVNISDVIRAYEIEQEMKADCYD